MPQDKDQPSNEVHDHDDEPLFHPEWLERWQARMSKNPVVRQVYRVVVFVIGTAITIGGIVLLPLPGPGWAIIILGLVILATEFTWADRLLKPVRRFVRWLAERAKDPKARKQNIAILVVFLVVVAVVTWVYLSRYGWTLEPFPFFD